MITYAFVPSWQKGCYENYACTPAQMGQKLRFSTGTIQKVAFVSAISYYVKDLSVSREEYLSPYLSHGEKVEGLSSGEGLYDLEKGVVEFAHGLGRDILSAK